MEFLKILAKSRFVIFDQTNYNKIFQQRWYTFYIEISIIWVLHILMHEIFFRNFILLRCQYFFLKTFFILFHFFIFRSLVLFDNPDLRCHRVSVYVLRFLLEGSWTTNPTSGSFNILSLDVIVANLLSNIYFCFESLSQLSQQYDIIYKK